MSGEGKGFKEIRGRKGQGHVNVVDGHADDDDDDDDEGEGGLCFVEGFMVTDIITDANKTPNQTLKESLLTSDYDEIKPVTAVHQVFARANKGSTPNNNVILLDSCCGEKFQFINNPILASNITTADKPLVIGVGGRIEV